MRRWPLVALALAACSSEPTVPADPDVAGISGSVANVEHWYAAPDGSAGGNGTAEHPWRLDSALAGGRKVAGVRPVGPGDTVWLRGGTYTGRFNTTTGGEPSAPVVYRAFPGERVIIDGNNGQGSGASVLAVQSDWVELWDLEITHGNPNRSAALPNLVSNYGSHNRFLRLVLHDGGVGLYNEHDASHVEIADCVIWGNGWFAGGEGHGHGLYLKSDQGPVTARGNVVFSQFAFGIHAFSDRMSTGIDSVVLEDNVVINNSLVHGGRRAANILVGGVTGFGAASRVALAGNLAYHAPGSGATNVKIGYDTTRNVSVSATGNVFAGGLVVMDVRHFQTALIRHDTLVGDPGDTSRVVALYADNTAGFTWRDNRFFNVGAASPRWRHLGTSYPLATWHARTGFTTDSMAASLPPRVRVSAGASGPGRALISVFGAAPGTISVTLPAGALAPGDSFELRNAQRLSAGAIGGGRFSGGAITVTLSPLAPEMPRGWSGAGPGTGSTLHVLLLDRR